MSEKTYRIGEAASKLNLKTYVLRFWEMEFPQIAPIRTEKGQRLYGERDLALLRRIRYLLHERGLTIEGARRILREEAARGDEYDDAELAMPEDGQDAALQDDTAAEGDLPERADVDDGPGTGARLEEKGRTEGSVALVARGAARPAFMDAPVARSGPGMAAPCQGSLLAAFAGGSAGTRPGMDMRVVMNELEDIRRLLTRNGNGDEI